jgi:PAS domain S-box-containing protein
LRRVLDTGEAYIAPESSYSIRRTSDGPLEKAWFDWSVRRVRLPGHSEWALLNTSWETTKLNRLQEELRDSEEQFRMLANSVPQLCWIAHGNGNIFWYNDRWYEYTGASPEQMIGWGWQSVHDPAVLPQVLQQWHASIKTRTPFEMIFPLRRHDGVFRSFLTRIVPIMDASGNVARWFGTNTDIDELRKTQEALAESEANLRLQQERLRLTRTAAKVAPWEYDPESEEFDWSDEVYAMLDVESLGKSRDQLLSLMGYAADRENATRALDNAAARKKECEFEFRIVRSDSSIRVIAGRGTPFYNQGQEVVLGMFIDVTPPINSPRLPPTRSARKKSGKRK